MNEKIPDFNSQFNIDKPDYFYQILLSGLDKILIFLKRLNYEF